MNGNETLMELFKNPETMHSLSFGDKMLASTITMIMGLGITFTVLILIWIFIAIMGKVMGVSTGSRSKAEAATKAAPVVEEKVEAVDQTADQSLAAVIAAAIAAYEGGNADNLVVRKITRLPGESTPWANAANEARMATRKMY